jgi:hypothetical protein
VRFQANHTEEGGGVQPGVDEPEKVNDHALDALRYVVMALNRGPSVTTVRNPWSRL